MTTDTPQPDQRTLLIFDLDETLIRGAWIRLARPHDFIAAGYHIYKRPFLDEFLAVCAEHFRLAVWSAASADYVECIAAHLFRELPPPEFVWSRNRCTQRIHPETMQCVHRKHLDKVKRRGYDLRRMLILEDTPEKVSVNYGNAIYIRPFEGDPADRELEYLAQYLPELALCENVRAVEKRGWRWRFAPREDAAG